jgi:hypothetical protein
MERRMDMGYLRLIEWFFGMSREKILMDRRLHSSWRVAMSMTKRYLTSLLSMRS